MDVYVWMRLVDFIGYSSSESYAGPIAGEVENALGW